MITSMKSKIKKKNIYIYIYIKINKTQNLITSTQRRVPNNIKIY